MEKTDHAVATPHEKYGPPSSDDDVEYGEGMVINASGHKQELDRNFGLISLCGLGITTGSQWPAFGVSVLLAIYNGGPAFVLYEFIASAFFYSFVYASIAELASSIPTNAGVYHWASVAAGPRFGKSCGFFAGWWNCLAWTVGAGSMALNTANIVISMWAIYHDDYVFQRWHVFVVYLITSWLSVFLVAYGNRLMPGVSTAGLVFTLSGFVISVIMCAVYPATTGKGYASSSFVWTEWTNQTGYTSNGFVFLLGMLNGAYTVGTPDVVSHLAEEIPNPRKNIPKAIGIQFVVNTVMAFGYAVALFYTITDLNKVFELTAHVPFPLAAIYEQATRSQSASIGLLLVILLPIVCTMIGGYLTASRILWTLARDKATPFPSVLAHVSNHGKSPVNAVLTCGLITTVVGCTYLGSVAAFTAITGSFVILSTLSYTTAILPNLLTGRKYVPAGPFALKGILKTLVPVVACVYMTVFNVIFIFPYVLPVTAANMNYTIVICGGFTLFIALWYMWKRSRGYEGPLIMDDAVRRAIAEAETRHGELMIERAVDR